ncbi:hypothetical protein [Rhizobium sp. RAF56]|jgi:hypothetical protein|uniref:hypothetical protein n=1 Tax=Rhizobium sp. RAF56 TaxID=3233062 RepID=UPI003F995CD4
MTTITYRHTGERHGAIASGSRVLGQVSSYAHRLADHWRQWRMERAIEAMPFDMRKDFGWPSADIEDERTRLH